MKRRLVIIGVVLAIFAGVGWPVWRHIRKGKGTEEYRTAKIERGDVIQSVRATGIIQPVKVVQVGTQVNGPITKLYVDFNDTVKAGDLVAQIDPIVYEARLAQDEANLTQSLAGLEQAETRLVRAENEMERSRKLAERQMLSDAELETAAADRDTLAAQVKVAHAAVAQAEASLRLSRANLNYTTIRSPVNGVVIARNVSEGQTVVASMSAQVLYQIATDLREVQVEASIPEADIGKIKPGQLVTFTVDAYDSIFTGSVAQVRLAAVTVQNVVTYPVVVKAENPDGTLFPGMTASIACEVARRENVLKVPNAALRFKPTENAATDGKRPTKAALGPKVWILDQRGAKPSAVQVSLGAVDGSFTEVAEAAPMSEGQKVIVGYAEVGSTPQGVVNPFAPQMPGRSTRRAVH